MFKDVLVHVGGGAADPRRLALALALTELCQARINGVHVIPPVDVSAAVGPVRAEKIAANLEVRQRADARAAEAAFRGALEGARRPHHWTTCEGNIATLLCREARYADLVILGQDVYQGAPERHPLPVAHSVALHAGRPVLIVPPIVAAVRGFDRVLVAWDGSREAVRAVHDALPLLQRAARVELAVVNPEEERRKLGEEDLRRLIDHLEQHRLNVVSTQVLRSAHSHARSILDWLQNGGFDLLVAGAYSKPMWFEFILDGTTQSLLQSSPVPILVSH